jgi:hypothetical protein
MHHAFDSNFQPRHRLGYQLTDVVDSYFASMSQTALSVLIRVQFDLSAMRIHAR